MRFEFFRAVSSLPDVIRILAWRKDGGPESKVGGWFIFESKRLFTVALLRFDRGSRPAYHEHAFNSWSWVLTGGLSEHVLGNRGRTEYRPSWRPVRTLRSTFHQVFGLTDSNWVLTIRGPWKRTWREHLPATGETYELTHGRVRA